MMCTFCPFSVNCVNGLDCPRALTAQVVQDAAEWGGPIAQYTDPPDCYEPDPVGEPDYASR